MPAQTRSAAAKSRRKPAAEKKNTTAATSVARRRGKNAGNATSSRRASVRISFDEHKDGNDADSYYSPASVVLISSDEEDGNADSYSPASVVSKPHGSPPDHKGKRQIAWQDGPSFAKPKCAKPADGFYCNICFESVEISNKFVVSQCAHEFCNVCIEAYVGSKIDQNVAVINCPDPGCQNGVVQMDHCRHIVRPDVFDRWNVLLCEDLLGNEKFYCPFKDCSALLISEGTVNIKEAECPHCHRLFCAQCGVAWHDGFKCEEFMKLGDDEKASDDLMLKKMADKNLRAGWLQIGLGAALPLMTDTWTAGASDAGPPTKNGLLGSQV